jgi:hypothetical protein
MLDNNEFERTAQSLREKNDVNHKGRAVGNDFAVLPLNSLLYVLVLQLDVSVKIEER